MRRMLVVSVCVLFCSLCLQTAAVWAQDSDGDGLTDFEETNTYGTDPLDADTDNDGANDYVEIHTMNTSPLDADSDDDGLMDNTEVLIQLQPLVFDSDGDGLGDGMEMGMTTPISGGYSDGSSIPYLGTNPALFVPDSDPNGHTDPLDYDSDNDGLSDGQEDFNRDGAMGAGEPNPVDADTDDDGIDDGGEDLDHNGNQGANETDFLDPDSDHDSLSDGLEMGETNGVSGGTSTGVCAACRVAYAGTGAGFVPDGDPLSTTDPLQPDSDFDQLADGMEDANHNGVREYEESDPNNADTDGDFLQDGLEVLTLTTDPTLPDTDVDSISDYEETNGGQLIDTDGDGVIDAKDTDSDDDGILDVTEGVDDADYDFLPNYRDTDSDGDGILDATEGEGDPDGDAIPNYLDNDSDGDCYQDNNPLEGVGDDNSDGVPNYLDPETPPADGDGDGLDYCQEIALGTDPELADSDADGIDDFSETDGGVLVDTDNDGTIDALDLDSDGDTLLDVTEGTEDIDGDEIPNYRDLDSDGDGDADAAEAAAGSDPYDPLSTLASVRLPLLTSIADVGNDQGRRVRLSWQRSCLDVAGSAEPILSYSIFRRITAGMAARDDEKVVHDKAGVQWDFVSNLPASGDTLYNTLAETLCDSTVDGMCWSVFFVRAHTATPTEFYDSPPDSGYSVDNLAPNPPLGFTVAFGSPNTLSWQPSADADFRYFKVYRCSTPDCIPAPSDLIETTAQTAWADANGSFSDQYFISAVDFAGNESALSAPISVSGVGGVPVPVNTLWQNTPNPFNPQTTIAFSLAQPEAVTLVVYDVSGHLVRTLLAGKMFASGRHEVLWDGHDDAGRRGASGVYFYSLQAPSFKRTRMMTMLK